MQKKRDGSLLQKVNWKGSEGVITPVNSTGLYPVQRFQPLWTIFIEMDLQFRQKAGIIGQGTLAFGCYGNFLLKPGKQFRKTCYIGTCGLEEIFFFYD